MGIGIRLEKSLDCIESTSLLQSGGSYCYDKSSCSRKSASEWRWGVREEMPCASEDQHLKEVY